MNIYPDNGTLGVRTTLKWGLSETIQQRIRTREDYFIKAFLPPLLSAAPASSGSLRSPICLSSLARRPKSCYSAPTA